RNPDGAIAAELPTRRTRAVVFRSLDADRKQLMARLPFASVRSRSLDDGRDSARELRARRASCESRPILPVGVRTPSTPPAVIDVHAQQRYLAPGDYRSRH